MTLKPVENSDRIDERIFVNEDLSRPENRINIAMFGLMAQEWFRTWLLSQLGITGNTIVYPRTNSKAMRPDFTIEDPDTRETLGWIEVEIGRDSGQLSRYQGSFVEPVKAIWGHAGDVSLEGIASRLKGELEAGTLQPQARMSVLLLRKLIVNALTDAASVSKPVQVSTEMRGHWLVQGLTESLGDRLDFDLKPIVPGNLKANAHGKEGFSLRVFSRIASAHDVSVLHIRGGATEIRFASRARLECYLPDHGAAIAAWCGVIRRLDGEIDISGMEQVPIRIGKARFAEQMIEFSECLVALSRPA